MRRPFARRSATDRRPHVNVSRNFLEVAGSGATRAGDFPEIAAILRVERTSAVKLRRI
jgi:hypothetical protein